MGRPEDAPPRFPPRLGRVVAEVTAPLDVVRTLPALVGGVLPRRDVEVRDVLVLPGYLAADGSTRVLRRVLARDGHRVRGWDLGRNLGDVPALATRVVEQVTAVAERTGQQVDLVGWSLGGVVAREVARRVPDRVRRITTLGTPLHGASFTAFQRQYDEDTLSRTVKLADRARRAPAPVPVTVIWSRRDGVVHWRAQQDRENPWAEHVEVGSTHLGMTVDGEVLRVLRDVTANGVHHRLRVTG